MLMLMLTKIETSIFPMNVAVTLTLGVNGPLDVQQN